MSTKLYIMKFEREGDCFLKVGKSNNCEKRLKDLSVNHTGVLLREYDDITIDWGKVEGRLHSDFKSQVYLSDILLTNSTESYPISLMDTLIDYIDNLTKLPEFTIEYKSLRKAEYLEIYTKTKELILKPNKYTLEAVLNNIVQSKLLDVSLTEKAILLSIVSFMNKDSCGIFSCEVKYKQLSYFLGTSVVVLRKALRKFEDKGYISSIEDYSCNKTYIWVGINEDEKQYNCQGVSSRTKKEWAAYFINRAEIEDLKEQMKAMQSLVKEARKHKPK